MQTVHLYTRLTHKYSDAWRHLDADRFEATLSLTPPQTTSEGNGYDDGGAYVRFARLPAGLDTKGRERIARAAADTLTSTRCRHEHDCCGCASYSTSAAVRGRTLVLRTRVGFNF